MSGHTPGPWSLRISSKGYENKFQIQREDGACLFSFGDSPFHDDAEADARLMAAAPKALVLARYAVDNPDFDSAVFDHMAREFIAEATGETP